MGLLLALALPDVPWYAILVPAAVTALVIRADAVLVGPYWTFLDLFPEIEAPDSWYERPALRFAIVRRYGYVTLAGAGMTLLREDWSLADAGLLGSVIAGLLLWPLAFHGLPYGIFRSDWQLVPWYVGVATSFVAASVLGRLGIAYVEAQADGDPLDWLADHGLEAVFWTAVGVLATAFSRGSFESLREKRRTRTKAEDS
jgi:hypothetical protein